MPFGTVLGVFTIIVLMQEPVKQLFGVNPPATIADQVLKGKKAGEIPVATAERFEYFFNKRSAAVTGVTIPEDLLKNFQRKQCFRITLACPAKWVLMQANSANYNDRTRLVFQSQTIAAAILSPPVLPDGFRRIVHLFRRTTVRPEMPCCRVAMG